MYGPGSFSEPELDSAKVGCVGASVGGCVAASMGGTVVGGTVVGGTVVGGTVTGAAVDSAGAADGSVCAWMLLGTVGWGLSLRSTSPTKRAIARTVASTVAALKIHFFKASGPFTLSADYYIVFCGNVNCCPYLTGWEVVKPGEKWYNTAKQKKQGALYDRISKAGAFPESRV